MNLSDALDYLLRDPILRENERRPYKLAVPVFHPGSVGGRPHVEVTTINPGFDWDAGVIFLETKEVLTLLTAGDVAAIHKSAREGQSWHAYQAYKKQEATIQELKLRIAELERGMP